MLHFYWEDIPSKPNFVNFHDIYCQNSFELLITYFVVTISNICRSFNISKFWSSAGVQHLQVHIFPTIDKRYWGPVLFVVYQRHSTILLYNTFTLSQLQTLSEASAEDDFRKHCNVFNCIHILFTFKDILHISRRFEMCLLQNLLYVCERVK